MSTAVEIRHYVFKLAPSEIFSVKELLTLGTRSSVDMALHHMVKNQFIIRLSRGLYVRNLEVEPLPDKYQIALAKAKTYGRATATDGIDAAIELRLITGTNANFSLATTGRAMQIQSIHGPITLKTAPERTVALGDTPAGKLIRALIAISQLYPSVHGEPPISKNDINKVLQGFSQKDRDDFLAHAHEMPGWLANMFAPRRSKVLPSDPIEFSPEISELLRQQKITAWRERCHPSCPIQLDDFAFCKCSPQRNYWTLEMHGD